MNIRRQILVAYRDVLHVFLDMYKLQNCSSVVDKIWNLTIDSLVLFVTIRVQAESNLNFLMVYFEVT